MYIIHTYEKISRRKFKTVHIKKHIFFIEFAQKEYLLTFLIVQKTVTWLNKQWREELMKLVTHHCVSWRCLDGRSEETVTVQSPAWIGKKIMKLAPKKLLQDNKV